MRDQLVLLADYREEVREIQLDRDASQRLCEFFGQRASEYKALSSVPYEVGYTPSADETMYLSFQLPSSLGPFATAVPGKTEPLTKRDLEKGLPRALIAILYGGSSARFLFQAVDRRNALGMTQSRVGAILWGENNFSLTREPALIPNNSIDALFESGRLYFRTDFVVRRFLPMEEHFREATDEDLQQFFSHAIFTVEDWGALKKVASNLIRRKLSRLLSGGRTYAPQVLRDAAKRAKVGLRVKEDLIVVPADAKDLRALVDLLDDAYLESLLDKSRCYMANSKRLIK